MTAILIALAIASYVLGSLPFGVLVARSKGVNILEAGSKNPGATNVWRVLGWKCGLTVFICDLLKAFIPSAATLQITHNPTYALGIGIAAILGHCWSPFLGFKGGKGIASGLGALLGSVPLVALCAFGVFLVFFAICRYVSLSSLLASISMILFGYLFHEPTPILIALISLCVFVFYRHRANIGRLLNGTESKFNLSKGKDAKQGGDDPPRADFNAVDAPS